MVAHKGIKRSDALHRGIQVINVACGGTLYQHVPEEYPRGVKHDCFPGPQSTYTRDYLAHPVRLDAGSIDLDGKEISRFPQSRFANLRGLGISPNSL